MLPFLLPFRGSGKKGQFCWDNRRAPSSAEANLLRYLYHCTTIPKRPGGQVYLRAELPRIPLPRTRVNKGQGAGTTALALHPMIVWLLLSSPYLAIHLLKERVAPLVALLVITH